MAIALDPLFADAYLGRAAAYYELGQNENAANDLFEYLLSLSDEEIDLISPNMWELFDQLMLRETNDPGLPELLDRIFSELGVVTSPTHSK